MICEWFWLISWFSKWNFFWCFSFKLCSQIDHVGPFLICFYILQICIDLLSFILINFSIFKMKFLLMLFFYNFVYKSITLDHFWDFSICLRFWLMFNDLWMILMISFNFQNEIAFDAFLLNFVYKSITLDHFWDFSHFFQILIDFS